MRVIAGKARRLNLKSAPGLDTRPTTDRIKETLFNIIGPDIPGCCFLDLFSGSGGIGIEALSRGALISFFVEKDPKALKCIRENLEFTRLAGNARVMPVDVIRAIGMLSAEKQRMDIVYMDPPYSSGMEEQVLRELKVSGIIDTDSLIIIEAGRDNKPEFIAKTGFSLIREKVYKTNKHFFLKLGD